MKRLNLGLAVAVAVALATATVAAATPSVAFNANVDQDHNALFPQNKQNEPAITQDPSSGVLIAGANDEIDEPLPVRNGRQRQRLLQVDRRRR